MKKVFVRVAAIISGASLLVSCALPYTGSAHAERLKNLDYGREER